MSLRQFIDGIRFNFINFFAFWIFNVCAGIWVYIVTSKVRADNPHVAEIRTACGTIMILVIGYFFGSSKSNSKKDETLNTVIENNKTLREEAKQNADAKDNA